MFHYAVFSIRTFISGSERPATQMKHIEKESFDGQPGRRDTKRLWKFCPEKV